MSAIAQIDMAHDRNMHGITTGRRRRLRSRPRGRPAARRSGAVAFLLCAVCALVAVAAVRASLPSRRHNPASQYRQLPPPAAAQLGGGIDSAVLLTEPNDGVRRLIHLIDHAQRFIFLESYILSDRRVVRALERAEAQGVAVNVLLEPHPFGLGTQPIRVADELRAAGIAVRWTPPRCALTHAKFLVVDDRVAVISTANFSASAFRANREFLAIDRVRADVREVSGIFRADWDRREVSVPDRDLFVAPQDAREKLRVLLSTARRSVRIYAEEIADPAAERQLIALAHGGVKVRVMLAAGQTPPAARLLARGGVAVRQVAMPYIHAKIVVIDSRLAFLGSENLSTQSLDRNREVGVLLRGPDVAHIDRVFDRDWRASS